MPEHLTVYIRPDGTMQFIYDDRMRPLIDQAHTAKIIRASRVDWDVEKNGWMVDLLSVPTPQEQEILKSYKEHWFWKKIKFEGDCWVIQGTASRGSIDYAAIRIPKHFGFGRKMESGHRISYWITSGKWEPLLRHRCDRPRCVRPSHLLTGTQNDNMLDAVKRGRAANGNMKLNPEIWQAIRNSTESSYVLATRYKVHSAHIRSIRRGRTGNVYRPKQNRPDSFFAPVRLGPFNLHTEAIEAEVAWLLAHDLQMQPLALEHNA